jgi:MFS transporter, DHA1 family, chloramphenicol resistance protein
MNTRGARSWLVALLASSAFATMTVAVMMGPVLISLAGEFNTSIASAGQLAAVIGISWGIVAPLVGPISDTYGRRRVALVGVSLMTVGVIGAFVAANYWGLLVGRLVMGAGAAMIPSNAMATIADRFEPAERGRPISVLISSTCLGYVVALPALAILGEIGGWRLSFAAVAGYLVLVLVWHWVAFPAASSPPPPPLSFMTHFARIGRSLTFWLVLLANVLYRSVSFAVFTYLVAFFVRAYGMRSGQTTLPVACFGLGAMAGSFLGGYVANARSRLYWGALGLAVGGLCIGVSLVGGVTPWTAVALGCAGMIALTIFEPVSWVVTAELAGESRATANGLLASSNQLGIVLGASAGGLLLATGGFPLVGIFCIGIAAAAGAIVVGIGLRARVVALA